MSGLGTSWNTEKDRGLSGMVVFGVFIHVPMNIWSGNLDKNMVQYIQERYPVTVNTTVTWGTELG